MKLIVGLGNPGRNYAGTRHNVGFEVLRLLAERHQGGRPSVKHDAELVDIRLDGEKLLLAAPQTFMNLSGRSVQQLVRFYQLEPEELLIVCDDLDLDVGRLRLRRSGSAGGQKGVANIIQMLGTNEIPRLRIGIGRPPARMAAADYVLSRFRSEEQDGIEIALQRAADAVETWSRSGIDAAMNLFNNSGDTAGS